MEPTATAPVAPVTHPGERALQRRAGVTRDDWGSAGTGALIPPVAAAFLTDQHLLVAAAAADDGSLWATALTGPPGFVTAVDDTTVRAEARLAIPDPLSGQLSPGRAVGLLAIDLATRRRMRINGRVGEDDDAMVVHTEQVYANCPKYIHTRRVTDVAPTSEVTAPPSTIGSRLTDDQQAWVGSADTFFVGTAAEGYGADASHRGGTPGFVAASATRITWPEYVGNGMFMTLGNLELDARCGLLLLDWERGHTLQVTGRAQADWDPGRAAAFPEATGLVHLDIDRVVEIRGHLTTTWAGGEPWPRNPAARHG